jgi:hypothetical protein
MVACSMCLVHILQSADRHNVSLYPALLCSSLLSSVLLCSTLFFAVLCSAPLCSPLLSSVLLYSSLLSSALLPSPVLSSLLSSALLWSSLLCCQCLQFNSIVTKYRLPICSISPPHCSSLNSPVERCRYAECLSSRGSYLNCSFLAN